MRVVSLASLVTTGTPGKCHSDVYIAVVFPGILVCGASCIANDCSSGIAVHC